MMRRFRGEVGRLMKEEVCPYYVYTILEMRHGMRTSEMDFSKSSRVTGERERDHCSPKNDNIFDLRRNGNRFSRCSSLCRAKERKGETIFASL